MARIATLTPTDTAGNLDAALKLADSLLTGRADGSVILLSDRAPADAKIAAPPIATSRDNLAITRFATRALPADPATSEVLVELQNFSAAPAKTELELSFDGRVLGLAGEIAQFGRVFLEVV